MSEAGFHPLTVVEVRPETDEAITLTLRPDAALAETFRFTPGQYLTLRAEIGGEEVRRSYSICAAPHDEVLRVAVKRVADGQFSNWAADTLVPGSTIDAMRPHGSFTWTFDPARRGDYAAFAGGSGVTPVLSLIKTGLAVEPRSRFTLLYGNRSSASVMFLEELADLKDRHLGRLQLYHFLTQEADDIELFNGRIDAGRLKRVFTSLVDPLGLDAAFICGPGPMMDAVEEGLRQAGMEPARILSERFGAAPVAEDQAGAGRELARRAEGFTMELTLDGRRRRVVFHAERGNILDAARHAGLPAPFACKAGVCATCRARVVAGEVRMKVNYGLSDEEVAAGYVLTCQAVPLGDGIRLDYDA